MGGPCKTDGETEAEAIIVLKSLQQDVSQAQILS
jgi:hypothetical protein